jgi:hypothetical protein
MIISDGRYSWSAGSREQLTSRQKITNHVTVAVSVKSLSKTVCMMQFNAVCYRKVAGFIYTAR